MTTHEGPRYRRSRELFARATKVIPWGIYGHASPVAALPGAFPYYAERAKGCIYWDVDGNEYIDYLCGYGPVILGHQHPEVEEVAARAQRDSLCLNHPGPVMVDLAERLVSLIEFSAWAVFGKNGSDMTTWAIQVAREHTKRRKILKVAGAYHGIDPWCTPGHGGLIDEDRAHVHDFSWNDLESFDSLVKRHRNDIAGVIMTPYHHPTFKASEMPAPGFWQHIEAECQRHGIVLILDDIRAGFRLNVRGSHKEFGFEPDIACYCKAIANGHALSASVGRRELRVAASKVFLTGSYWNSAPAMHAAMKCLEIMEKSEVVEHLRGVGRLLQDGLVAVGREAGYQIVSSGPTSIPFITFDEDPDLRRQQWFCGEMTAEGSLLHPHHNWFISAAHNNQHIEGTLKTARKVLEQMRQSDI